jgi:hypothetical protein
MEEKRVITRFEYQRLLGYQVNQDGEPSYKVFEAKAIFSDGTTEIIYGRLKMGRGNEPGDMIIQWDFSRNQEQPKIQKNAWGIDVQVV